LIYALCMRHEENDQYRAVLQEVEIERKLGNEISDIGDLNSFKTGLFGATEMLVDSLMYLVDSGIMKKKVFDHVLLQRLLNEGLILEDKITPDSLYLLLARGAIQPKLTKENFEFLQRFGVFKKNLTYKYGNIYFEDQSFIEADLDQNQFVEAIIEKCMGNRLINGAIIHADFFLGPTQFYDWLRELPEWKRSLIHMKSVRKINQLYGHEEIDRLHRKNARFVNTCLMMTLSGAAVSDGLEDGRVISVVGGQYNFVEMAQALPDGRSILQLRSTRSTGANDPVLNIVYNYGHITIPRHLRDIVVTEYGIADIRLLPMKRS
jgi:acyl-CoA hydrolase